jgi:hypothetical protein
MGGESAASLSSGTVTAESVNAESDRSESELWLQSERTEVVATWRPARASCRPTRGALRAT